MPVTRSRPVHASTREQGAASTLRALSVAIGPPDVPWLPMDHKQRVREVMSAMSHGRVAPLFEAMAEDVTWRWMGLNQWSRTFEGKQMVVDKLFGGATETHDNNYCWVLRFQDGLIQEVREFMDTQLVAETFGADGTG